ncbi:MAG: chemotaxis response regulator protein-glutamate methylesterase [Planctomycetes bacterium]|nr:chemotaxis response regulator protein-glutamate methylesterase [Planctomycetota bacterium]NUQ34641.1 chemotaxis response regulator protein-glutamate methylesterase [Planctomycetaceae bacterium]
MTKTRVLIVDDSATIRSALRIMIRKQPDMEVVGTAGDGAEGVRLTGELKPDIVLMDIEMPVMTGIQAVREIMSHHPAPVLIFSSIAEEAAPATFEALEAGAVDFVTKGGGGSSIDIGEIRETLLAKIRAITGGDTDILARNPATTLVRNRESFKNHLLSLKSTVEPDSLTAKRLAKQINTIDTDKPPPDRTTRLLPTDVSGQFYQQPPVGYEERKNAFIGGVPRKPYHLVAIGCSTGGPQALHTVLSRIPGNFPLPIVVVQHMPQTFVPTFASRLGKNTECKVEVATHGEVLKAGTIYIAPGGMHLRVRARAERLSFDLNEQDVDDIVHKPSVDVLFESIHKAMGGETLAAVLTGMGRDGAAQAKRLHNDGATVIAQTKDTCVVYGMPRAVITEQSADLALPVEEIGDAIVYLTWEAGHRFVRNP